MERTEIISVSSFYCFSNISEESLKVQTNHLLEEGIKSDISGLIILAPEGINATIAGGSEGIGRYKALVNGFFGGKIEFKDSIASKPPFRRLSVQIRDEIVTFGEELKAGVDISSHFSPAEFHTALENPNAYNLVDVRNDYEIRLGSFPGAINPGTRHFHQFNDYIKETDLPRDKPVLMYCTGGVRCEKAAIAMRREGFKEVFQLSGGILSYLEAFGERGHFSGECFVFDHRVALDVNLRPSEKYGLCPFCGDPASEDISCLRCGSESRLCPKCYQTEIAACSKNCRYQLKIQRRKRQG